MPKFIHSGLIVAGLLAGGGVFTARPAAAEVFDYNITLKAKIVNANGSVRKITTTGTLHIDDQTHQAIGQFDLISVMPQGSGEGVFGTKYLLLSMDLQESNTTGRFVARARFNRDKSKLIQGKFAFGGTDGMPLPGGAIASTGTFTGVRVTSPMARRPAQR